MAHTLIEPFAGTGKINSPRTQPDHRLEMEARRPEKSNRRWVLIAGALLSPSINSG